MNKNDQNNHNSHPENNSNIITKPVPTHDTFSKHSNPNDGNKNPKKN